MNLPNFLTIIRFAMVPLYLFVYFSQIPERIYWAVFIILFAGLTDILDGYLARRNKQITELGSMLDPLADKCMMIAVFLSLLISEKISIWAAVAIIFRDISMIVSSVFFHLRGKKTVPANILGKITTVLFYIGLFLCLFNASIADLYLWGVIGLSYFTSLIYMFQFKSVNKGQVM